MSMQSVHGLLVTVPASTVNEQSMYVGTIIRWSVASIHFQQLQT